MNKVGALKTMPATWQDLFSPRPWPEGELSERASRKHLN
jgi:hypothetical protein